MLARASKKKYRVSESTSSYHKPLGSEPLFCKKHHQPPGRFCEINQDFEGEAPIGNRRADAVRVQLLDALTPKKWLVGFGSNYKWLIKALF